jgi:hypothetical protein
MFRAYRHEHTERFDAAPVLPGGGGLGGPAEGAERGGEVVKAGGDGGVVGAECSLADGESALFLRETYMMVLTVVPRTSRKEVTRYKVYGHTDHARA